MWTIPICYDKEFALDIDKISKSTDLSKSSIIKIHLNQIYRVNMIGFIPGFVYMKNLNDQLKISRKKNPRLTVPEGSIGIADNMCGIYNIQSPGGWNILGRTPLSFFSIYNSPPIKIKPEDEIQFKKINKKEFFKILHEK
jgi:inhibitor of KinA